VRAQPELRPPGVGNLHANIEAKRSKLVDDELSRAGIRLRADRPRSDFPGELLNVRPGTVCRERRRNGAVARRRKKGGAEYQ
jgi:hypothetical protein